MDSLPHLVFKSILLPASIIKHFGVLVNNEETSNFKKVWDFPDLFVLLFVSLVCDRLLCLFVKDMNLLGIQSKSYLVACAGRRARVYTGCHRESLYVKV